MSFNFLVADALQAAAVQTHILSEDREKYQQCEL